MKLAGAPPLPAAPSLALAFLLCGLGYALPFNLFPADYPPHGPTSPEVLNLRLLVAWMGLAHFGYAYHGQARSLWRRRASGPGGRLLLGVLLGAGALLGLRTLTGLRAFDALVWIYFMPHLWKAERHFAGATAEAAPFRGALAYGLPAMAFAFLTFVLFAPADFTVRPWVVPALGLGVAAYGLACGAWRELRRPGAATPVLLAFFLIGEGFVWGTYRPYMSPQFREGVYVFHVALASFYHYLRSYDFARVAGGLDGARYFGQVALVNLPVILAGWVVLHRLPMPVLNLVFDVHWFTFWVGLHLVTSDVFTWLRHRRA